MPVKWFCRLTEHLRGTRESEQKKNCSSGRSSVLDSGAQNLLGRLYIYIYIYIFASRDACGDWGAGWLLFTRTHPASSLHNNGFLLRLFQRPKQVLKG